MAACDAVIQEIESIRALAPGDVCHLYPTRTPGTHFPRRLWGMQQLRRILRADREVDLHHVFNPDPFAFLVLHFVRKPIIYTAVTGLAPSQRATTQELAKYTKRIIVSSSQDLSKLQEWGVRGAAMVRPGIDTSHFSVTYPSPSAPPTLLMGSAPWSEAQFRSKGVLALLELAQARPELRLIFLWRGVLEAQMRRRVAAAGLGDRVEIINQQVDVNQVLARVHAGVAFADGEALIKAYPHSLLESLAAGKPVILSRAIPMSGEAISQGCGIAVDSLDVETITRAVDQLFTNYQSLAQASQRAGQTIFGQRQMAEAYLALYHQVLQENDSPAG